MPLSIVHSGIDAVTTVVVVVVVSIVVVFVREVVVVEVVVVVLIAAVMQDPIIVASIKAMHVLKYMSIQFFSPPLPTAMLSAY